MADHILSVVVVADFEQKLDTDAAKRCEPHRAAVKYLDDVGACLGDRVEGTGEHSRAIHHKHLEHDVPALTNKHLFENAGEKIGVDVAPAEHDADVFVGRDID